MFIIFPFKSHLACSSSTCSLLGSSTRLTEIGAPVFCFFCHQFFQVFLFFRIPCGITEIGAPIIFLSLKFWVFSSSEYHVPQELGLLSFFICHQSFGFFLLLFLQNTMWYHRNWGSWLLLFFSLLLFKTPLCSFSYVKSPI